MTLHASPPLLRIALLVDAVVSGATGLAMALAAGPGAGLLGLPEPLLRWAGLFLLPYAALLAWLARRDRLPRPLVWAIIGCNALWAIDCLLLLASGWVAPTTLGYVFVIGQAAVVAGFAELQYLGLRRMAAPSLA